MRIHYNSGTRTSRASTLLTCALGLTAFLVSAAPVAAQAAAMPEADPAAAQLAAGLAALHLPEPLVATGPTGAAEDAALLAAARRYQDRTEPDDFSALTGFLAAYPRSAWRAVVLTDLGIDYLHYGYFSKALYAFNAAWHDGKSATAPQARAITDRALGELVRLVGEFGYRDRLAALLKEIGTRPVGGAATELVAAGREMLWLMNTDPKHLYNCGPMALKMLLLAQHASQARVGFLNWVRADGPQGTSLAEVAALARKAHFPLEPMFRKPGEPVPVPSIAHWKVGHFAAIVGERYGPYEVRDPTFGRQSLWVTRAALDAEASGYFLVPAKAAQAAGWRRVTANEAGQVWGAGPGVPDPAAPPPCGGGCGCKGLCVYGINEQTVSLNLMDSPVGYTPPIGPSAAVSLAYDMYDVSQPALFNFFNVSQKWTFNWLSFVVDDPGAPGTGVQRYDRDDGFLYSQTGYDSGTHRFAPEEDDASVLELKSTSPVVYQRFLQDGTIETYAEPDGSTTSPRHVFLSEVADPQGNALTLNYGKIGGEVRLLSLTDAVGRRTSFSYGSAVSPLLITKITDPFGRSAELTYDGAGRLSSITDVLGLTSKFTYDGSSLIDQLTTPYGSTQFNYGISSDAIGAGDRRFLNIVDPLGYGEREETFEPATDVPASEPADLVPQGMTNIFNGFLNDRDSFHWNKHQYAAAGCTVDGGCDYHDARVTHFTHDANDIAFRWSTIESVAEPLEDRVWYTYPGQPNNPFGGAVSGTYDRPNAIGRVLDDGQTQLTQLAYNAAGNPTQLIDPVDRTTMLSYAANEIDVETITQTTGSGQETIAAFTYNNQHRPLTYTDAAGRTTHYAYNSAGQLTSLTNALGQKTSYVYNATGDLTTIVNADGKVAASFTYDAFDRVASYTDSQGWKVDFAYDDADRLTRATYLDGTTDQYTYERLDLVSEKDRQGYLMTYAYDADRRLVSVTDPLGHVTRYGYFEDGTLKSPTDPNGHTTSWDVDVESRPTAKIYADGSETTYGYELRTSRLASATDALGQSKNYTYALDDRLAGIGYRNALNPTPNVSFAYDPYFPRLTSMTDGSGTTTYSYVRVGKLGALHLAQESVPLPNGTIAYAYDPLGRVSTRTVGGASPETFQYDKIDRLVDHTDPLGNLRSPILAKPRSRRSGACSAAMSQPFGRISATPATGGSPRSTTSSPTSGNSTSQRPPTT